MPLWEASQIGDCVEDDGFDHDLGNTTGNQLDCQDKCINSSNCVGITYLERHFDDYCDDCDDGIFYRNDCRICQTAESLHGAFPYVFYKKPGNHLMI